MTVFGYNLSPTATYYSARKRIYCTCKSKSFGCALISFSYIIFLLWFTHVDIICEWASNSHVDSTQVSRLLVQKHAHFLMLITNWGLLFMLFFDLIVAKRIDNPKAFTFLNLVGVFAILSAFGCAAGDVIDQEAAKKLGLFINSDVSKISLLTFAGILCYLKYVSIKPKE